MHRQDFQNYLIQLMQENDLDDVSRPTVTRWREGRTHPHPFMMPNVIDLLENYKVHSYNGSTVGLHSISGGSIPSWTI